MAAFTWYEKAAAVLVFMCSLCVLLITLRRIWRSTTFQLWIYRFGASCGYTLYREVLEVWQRGYESWAAPFEEGRWKGVVAQFKEDLEKNAKTDSECAAMRVWRHALGLEPRWFGEPSVFVKRLQWWAVQAAREEIPMPVGNPVVTTTQ